MAYAFTFDADVDQHRKTLGLAIERGEGQRDLLVSHGCRWDQVCDVVPAFKANGGGQGQLNPAVDEMFRGGNVPADQGLDGDAARVSRSPFSRRPGVDERVDELELQAILASDRRAHGQMKRVVELFSQAVYAFARRRLDDRAGQLGNVPWRLVAR